MNSNINVSIDGQEVTPDDLDAISTIARQQIKSYSSHSREVSGSVNQPNFLQSLSTFTRTEIIDTLQQLSDAELPNIALTQGNKVTALVLPIWSSHRVMLGMVGEVIETQIRMLPSPSKWVPIKFPKPNDPADGGQEDTWQLDRSGIWEATFEDVEDTAGFIWIRGRHAGNKVMLELEQAIVDRVQQEYGIKLGEDRKWRTDESSPNWFEELNSKRLELAELYTQSPIYDPLQDGMSALQLIGVMGADLDVANDARASFGKQSHEFTDKDGKLINYLASAKPPHTSPFRGCVLKFKVKAPLFCCRQWWKTAVASSHVEDQLQHNEMSFRYSEITDPEFYLPDRFRSQSTSNRQASGEDVGAGSSELMRGKFKAQYAEAYRVYELAIAEGVAREQARMVLPPAVYTSWVWTCSLQSLLNFIDLRKGNGAQEEIVAYTRILDRLVGQLFPAVHEAWAKKDL
jgi:thymidylate synthase (FAD)